MVDFSRTGVLQAVRSGQLGLASHIASSLLTMGHPDAGPALAALGGRGNVPMLGRGGSSMPIGSAPGKVSRVPTSPYLPGDLRAPGPGDFPILTQLGHTAYGGMDAFGGGQPFALVGFVPLAAGAQTQGTDLVDFHAATANPTIISTADLVLGNIEVFEASLYLGVRGLTTLGFENAAFLLSSWVIEYINGIEKARWTPKQLACVISHFGLLTSGSQASNYSLDLPAVPWHRKYDPNIKAKTAWQITATTTTVSGLDLVFVETGTRP